MAELDKVPSQNQITIETVKIDDDLFNKIKELSTQNQNIVAQTGQMYLRKMEIQQELESIEDALEQNQNDFKLNTSKMSKIGESIDDEYPQARIDIQNGTIQYQPGAPTRKQMAEQAQQQSQPQDSMRVVKD
jgi:hypothetical protein